MKETNVSSADWRTVQLFLDENGIAEVEVNPMEKRSVRCSCVKFSKSSKCAHAAHVKSAMEENDGHYEISIPLDIDEDEAFEAAKNKDSFREFILKYGKVEVI